jgi:hypothetical protein
MIAFVLAGCGGGKLASVSGSCGLFEGPEYVVTGADPYSDNWVNRTVESGIGGCNWERPTNPPPAATAPVVKPPPVVVKRKRRVLKAGVTTPLFHKRPGRRGSSGPRNANRYPRYAMALAGPGARSDARSRARSRARKSAPVPATEPVAEQKPKPRRKPPGWFQRWREKHFPHKT